MVDDCISSAGVTIIPKLTICPLAFTNTRRKANTDNSNKSCYGAKDMKTNDGASISSELSLSGPTFLGIVMEEDNSNRAEKDQTVDL